MLSVNQRFVCCFLLATFLSGCVLFDPPRAAERQVAEQKLHQLKEGMTRDEVERILFPYTEHINGPYTTSYQFEQYTLSEHYAITVPYFIVQLSVALHKPYSPGSNQAVRHDTDSDQHNSPNDRICWRPYLN